MRKIEVIRDRLVLAIAGYSGMAQLLNGAMANMLDVETFATPDHAMQCIIKHSTDALQGLLAVAAARKAAGEAGELFDWASESLVGLRVGSSAHLFCIRASMAAERLLETSPFVVIGTGATTMHSFIEYLRQKFLGEELPDLADAILTLLWGLRFALATGARDVGGNPQVTVIPDDPAEPITQLGDKELAEHQDILGRAESLLLDLRRAARGESELFGKSHIPE
jgi:hypothetical protein